MKQLKGFSLIEVLMSLMLTLTLALALLDHQLQIHQLIQQYALRIRDLHSFDHSKESLNSQLGFSLIEVLISLFLVSIMMLSLSQMYLGTKRQYLQTQEFLESSLELQWVRDLLSDSIRRAGFTPCLSIDNLETYDTRREVHGLRALQIQSNPQQSIQSNRMRELFSELISIQSPTQIEVSNVTHFQEDKPILIADCEHAEVHEILRVITLTERSVLTLTKPLRYSYSAPAYIGEWVEEKWFIKSNQAGGKSLYHKVVQTEELTALIHHMRIKKQRIHQRLLIDIDLELDKKEKHQLLVAVRAA